MQDRTNQICDSTSTATKFQHLRDIFQANAFPKDLVTKMLTQNLTLLWDLPPPDVEPPKIFCLP